MLEPTNEAISARAEQLASLNGLDWVAMFRPADERSEQRSISDGHKEKLLEEARRQLIAEQTEQTEQAPNA